jgi:cell division septal protein FtsQ
MDSTLPNAAARRPRIALPALRRPRAIRLRRPSWPAVLIAVLLMAAIAAGGWLLVRNSSLVAVREVRVVGLSGYYDRQAKRAVTAAALQMTTMNFDARRIEQVAGEFADVASVRVETDYPHAATVWVNIRRPVLIVRLNGRTVTLSQDGQVINPVHAVSGLPHIEASGAVTGGRVTGGKALVAAKLLGAAPDVLLRRVRAIRWGRLGVVVALDKGPDLYFGSAADAALKWRDAATVLASAQSRGAAYLDLRVAGRPAIGGLGGAPAPVTASSSAASTATTTAPPAATTDAQPAPAAPVTAAPAPQATVPAPPTQQPVQQAPAAAGGAAPAR